MTEVVGFFAGLVHIAASCVMILVYLFVSVCLLAASTLLAEASASRWFHWINSRRLRIDCSPHESRGWKP